MNAPGRKAGCADLDQSNILGIPTDRTKQKHCWSPERGASRPGVAGGSGRVDLEAGQEAWVTVVQNPQRIRKRSAKAIL